MIMTLRTQALLAAAVTSALVVTGCSSADSQAPSTQASTSPHIASSSTLEPIPTPDAVVNGAPTATVLTQSEVVAGLAAPWDIEFMPDGSMLVSERDTGTIQRVRSGFATSLNGPGAEALRSSVNADGEGGLLGLAISPKDPTLLYAYVSRAEDNAVVRMSLTGELLSAPVDVVTGIPHGIHHNGGRIDFSPGGMLYIATGDTGDEDLADNPDSLAGKVLRVVADGTDNDGAVPSDNPTDSLVWSMGHRNVEGFDWAADGRMYATEFGENSTDELNRIKGGSHYGWPYVEGLKRAPSGATLGTTVDGYTYPVATWPVADSSPSGMAITADAIYVAALRGEGIWRIPLTQDGIGTPARLDVDLGRVRDIEVGPGGALYVLSNNTDGRGEPREGDDRVYRITVT